MSKHLNGSALIMALLITAVVAAIATAIAVNVRIFIQENALAYQFAQSSSDLQGMQYWGEAQLRQNGLLSHAQGTIENYPQRLPATLFNRTQLSGEIVDAQGLFNLNALSNPAAQAQFSRLLTAVAHLTNFQAAQIAQAVSDWINRSNADATYLSQQPAYRAAHRPLVSSSELRLINGISANLLRALLPYVVALPTTNNQINVITAPLPVLRSLSFNMTTAQANKLILCRQRYTSLKAINAFKRVCFTRAGLQLDPQVNLVLASHYFLLLGQAQTATQNLVLFSLVKRTLVTQANKVTASVKLIWQSFNTL